jgi:ABC-type multidrug transport system ATPase subunit
MAAVAEVQGMWQRYTRSRGWLLRDVDLILAAGRITVVVGGNGSGKSTLLRVVAGVSAATKGRVHRARASVSYLPDILPVELRFTPDRYLRHLAGMRGSQSAATLTRSRRVLERLQLSAGPEVPIAHLSRGNRQKVVLAQALGFAADLTVLDEPFSGLDEPAIAALVDLLAEARSEGCSVLVSAHHPTALVDGDDFYQLSGGRLQATARPVVPDVARTNRSPVRLVLRPTTRVVSTAELTQLPGVRSAEDDPLSGQAVVLTTDPDTLLRSALGSGWSFVQGNPHSGDPDEPIVPDDPGGPGGPQ